MLHTIRGLRIPIRSSDISELSENYSGATLPLILMDMKDCGLFSGKLPIEYWERIIDGDRIKSDWTWLMAYEGIRNNWLRDISGVLRDDFFKTLNKYNISFYDRSKNVENTAKTIRIKNIERIFHTLKSEALLKFLRNIRTDDFGEVRTIPFDDY